MPVYRGVRIAYWRGQLSKHKLAAWFPNLNDLRVWDLVPDSPCPADHGSGNDRGQDEKTLQSFPSLVQLFTRSAEMRNSEKSW